MEKPLVENKEEKKPKKTKTPRKSKKKPEVLKKLIIETGLFVLSFD